MSDEVLKKPLALFDIRGKTAVITGAPGAFGSLAAKVLAGAGANTVLAASRAEGLKKGAAECEALGGKTEIVAQRPRSEEDCEAIVAAAVAKFGRVDILVVASGLNKVAKIIDQKPEDFLEVMDANVTQSWLMARAAGRQMLKQGGGGKVILTSSARGLLGHPAGYTAYCASKSAVDGITKALGCEWGDTGITVNALGPTVFRPPPPPVPPTCARASWRACRKAASASRPTSPGRCSSSPRAPPTSTPGTSSTPTAATRQADDGREGAHRRHRRRADGAWPRPGFCARRPRRGGLRRGRGEPCDRQGPHFRQPARSRRRSARGRARAADRRPCGGPARRRLRGRGGVGKSAAQADALRRDRDARARRHHSRQQHLGDPDHRHHARLAPARAGDRHPLVEPALSRSARRGDRHRMDVTGRDRIHHAAAQ